MTNPSAREDDGLYLPRTAEAATPPVFAGDLPPPASGSALPIRFTASGSEYFRIWSVNLLLTLVTLGLYHPWAKVRKLRYFYGNTWVGDHAFDFHGDPRRMLRGTLLVGVLFLAYSFAGQFSPIAGAVALVAVAGIAPALFCASLRFRMANTSWRGMRFHFNGSVAGAYGVLLPMMLPAVLILGVTLLTPQLVGGDDATWTATEAVALSTFVSVGAMLLALVLFPLLVWGLKRYMHNHYALGAVQSQLTAGPGSFYKLFGKAMGVSMLAGTAFGALTLIVSGIVGVSLVSATEGGSFDFDKIQWILLALLAMGIGYVVVAGVSNTYMASRLQNLVWNGTRSTEVRFHSQLHLPPLLRLTLKNWLLIFLTLGLYWPFAAVSMARLKLQAVTVHTRRPVEALSGRIGAGARDATGDAAGDVFGIDFGL